MWKNIRVFSLIFLLSFVVCKKKTALEQAEELIEKGKYNEAIKKVRKELVEDSLNVALHVKLCQAYIGADSVTQAARTYLDLYALDSVKAENKELKVYLANFLKLDPYRLNRLTRRRSNEYAPTPSSLGLLYASDRYGSSDIYLLKDKRAKRVIRSGRWNSNPVPVKGGICYSSGFDIAEEIYYYQFKDKKIKHLTKNQARDYPTGSNKEGDKLLFLSDQDGDWDVYLMDLNEGKTKQITKNDYVDGDAVFSPDDKNIIFVTKVKGEEKIVLADLNGKIKRVFPFPEVRHPSFVDSQRIVYQGKEDRNWNLYLYDIKKKRKITLTRSKRDDYRPSAHFGKNKIYFVRKIGRQWDIFEIDLGSVIKTDDLVEKLQSLTGRDKIIK